MQNPLRRWHNTWKSHPKQRLRFGVRSRTQFFEAFGWLAWHRIRALADGQKSEVAAVALTAYARLEDRTAALRAGFQNHLPKPVEPAELLAVVHSLANPRSKRGSS